MNILENYLKKNPDTKIAIDYDKDGFSMVKDKNVFRVRIAPSINGHLAGMVGPSIEDAIHQLEREIKRLNV